MTGNDIVDRATAAAESNWRRKGFLEKIFTPQERQYILDAVLPDEMVWKLWSMKESAYKIHARQYGERSFSPQKINCSIVTGSTGRAGINDIIYYTITTTTENYIYSIAGLSEGCNASVINSCFVLPRIEPVKQQAFIHDKMISQYASACGIIKKNISVIKDKNGIPSLYCSNDDLRIPVSITHHGDHAAFTIYQKG